MVGVFSKNQYQDLQFRRAFFNIRRLLFFARPLFTFYWLRFFDQELGRIFTPIKKNPLSTSSLDKIKIKIGYTLAELFFQDQGHHNP